LEVPLAFLTTALVAAVCLSYPPWKSAGYGLLLVLALAYPFAMFGLFAAWFYFSRNIKGN
jgi:hypothetical protein